MSETMRVVRIDGSACDVPIGARPACRHDDIQVIAAFRFEEYCCAECGALFSAVEVRAIREQWKK